MKLTALQRQIRCLLVASGKCRDPLRVRLGPDDGSRGAGLDLVDKLARLLNELSILWRFFLR